MTNINTDHNAMADAFAKAGIDTTTCDHTGDDREPGHAASPTAAACDAAKLYGATPDPDEPDNRPVWDKDGAIAGTEQAFHVLAQDIAPDGYQLADEREGLLWGFVNTFHAQVQRLDRAIDGIAPEMRELGRAQDGTEVKAWQLERLTERAHNLGDRRDAFEKLRDFAAEAYTAETGKQWRPRHGSHTSHTGRLTSAAIDARDFIRARKDRETRANLPDGTLVAVAGGKEAEDADAIWTVLDRVKDRHADMILLHGGGPGAERIAASWAERNEVHQIVCKPDWDRHGRAAPFRRNDDLLNLLPKGLVAFPGSGITENLIDKARQIGIPVHRVAA